MKHLYPKGSLGWYKEKIQFQIDMLDDCPKKTELQEMLDGVKRKTDGSGLGMKGKQ